jgi:hypothetical protein
MVIFYLEDCEKAKQAYDVLDELKTLMHFELSQNL